VGLELALRVAGMGRPCRVARVALWRRTTVGAQACYSLDHIVDRSVRRADCRLPNQRRKTTVALGRE
jgi:hypothetical protein